MAKPASATTTNKHDIHDSVYNAIVEHRLLPGTKLPEERIAELFNVSRTQVRGVLQQLSAQQLVTLIPNRGAFVSTPSADEARDVLAVRKTLEPFIVQRVISLVAQNKNTVICKQLKALVSQEHLAHQQGDRHTVVRLSGEFHVLLSKLSGSKILYRMMRELTPLTCLAILTFEASLNAACPDDEHSELIHAIEATDTPLAMKLMVEHLNHIEVSLHLDRGEYMEVDLAEILLGNTKNALPTNFFENGIKQS